MGGVVEKPIEFDDVWMTGKGLNFKLPDKLLEESFKDYPLFLDNFHGQHHSTHNILDQEHFTELAFAQLQNYLEILSV